jgi:hypothetical protein
MNEESKLIELFKKYPGIAARIRRSFAYHYDQIQREIESEVATINKDDAATIIQEQEKYKPLIMEKFQYYKDYFEIVHIQTQELTSIGFKTAILDL